MIRSFHGDDGQPPGKLLTLLIRCMYVQTNYLVAIWILLVLPITIQTIYGELDKVIGAETVDNMSGLRHQRLD